MENILRVTAIRGGGRSVTCSFEVEGDWISAFKSNEFIAEYDVDISTVPLSVLIVPFLGNVMPIAWVYDAAVICPVCDKDFYDCLDLVRDGYQAMYPSVSFDGVLCVDSLNCCTHQDGGRALAFFSGGVDAYQTLIAHREECPSLVTIRGADISLDDDLGWGRMLDHLGRVSSDFGVCSYTSTSTFRTFLDETVLNRIACKGGDNWWHGFQHGLGLLTHAAPLAYLARAETVYIASSFTAMDKGRATCASDPTIDNHVRFCGCGVVHDGYELTRQDKVASIVAFSKRTGISVRLRVCWESTGGSNCCRCEKCLRSILGIYAEKADPTRFGFNFDDLDELGRDMQRRFAGIVPDEWLESLYVPTQKALRMNYALDEVSQGWRWFYEGDVAEMGHLTLSRRALRKLKKIVQRSRERLRRLNGC